MKRSISVGLMLALVLALSVSVTAFAQDAAAAPIGVANFVDSDGDGVCDYFEDGTGLGSAARYGAANGQGVGMGTGIPGQNYVDADGDGVCDNCTGTPNANGAAYGANGGANGAGYGAQNSTGNGAAYGAQNGAADGTGTPLGRGPQRFGVNR